MSKHSPAPWRYCRETNPGEVLDDDFNIVASTMDPASEEQPTEVEEANGHLIAAAPDLLAALKGALRYGVTFTDAAVRQRFLDVITQAEGE